MENTMKKLIALFAVSTVATTSAIAGVALSGSASVTYDDKGSAASATSYDADLTITGTAGATTFTSSMDIDGGSATRSAGANGGGSANSGISLTSSTMSTTIGPLTVTADMHDEDDQATVATTGGLIDDSGDNRSVTVSLDAPVGDATIGLDNSGDVTVSGTFSGVTISHTVKNGADKTVGSASIAGMDVSLTNDAGSSTWTIGTTVAGTAVTVGSDKSISATFGVTGNTVVVSHTAERASATSTTSTKYSTAQKDAYTTIAVSRDLTSGATLAATYNTFDSSLTLKASVAF
jgi:hypothetical protein